MAKAMTPAENDLALAELGQQHEKLEGQLAMGRARMHQAGGVRKAKRGQGRYATWGWQLTTREAMAAVRRLAGEGDDYSHYLGGRPSAALAADDATTAGMGEIAARVRALEENWLRAGWSRWYPCLNSDGHVHASERGCSTVRFDTRMGWFPELSGATVEEAIAQFGPRLCSVCFADAPSDWCRSLPEINREQRLAEKAAREEAKFAKRLRPAEQFRDHRNDWVETVARCREILRDEVELRDYYGRGEHPWHPASVTAARKAAEVLLTREAAAPGTGAVQAEIDTITERAEKKNRKAGARI